MTGSRRRAAARDVGAAGPFGYAMAQYDPLFARTFFTDFVRSATKTPAAVSGVRLALKRLLR